LKGIRGKKRVTHQKVGGSTENDADKQKNRGRKDRARQVGKLRVIIMQTEGGGQKRKQGKGSKETHDKKKKQGPSDLNGISGQKKKTSPRGGCRKH